MGRDTALMEDQGNPTRTTAQALLGPDRTRTTTLGRGVRTLWKLGRGRNTSYPSHEGPPQTCGKAKASLDGEDDSPQTKDDAPLPNMSCRPACREAHETTNHRTRGSQSPSKGENDDTGEPCALKGASTVRLGGVE